MSATAICPELEGLWLGLCAADKATLSPVEVVFGFAHHHVRHGCDLLDVRAVMIDVLLLMTDDPSIIASLAAEVEDVGDRCVVWRDFLLRAFGNVVVFAADRAAADAVVARRELYRLCRRWDLPSDLALWCG